MSAFVVTLLVHVVAGLVAPIVVVGLVNRTKSLWAGRRGPPILQLGYDLVRLLRKRPVYSTTTTWVFRLGPWAVLGSSLVSSFVAPWLGVRAPLSFAYDFVWFAYVWGLGRMALMLGALDTGSSFEGMGASREATFAAVLEPAFFLVAGATCLVTRERSFGALLSLRATEGIELAVWLGSVIALLVLVQVESARMPVDDPTTHLELTMVHEVMILDHSGPDLAALQAGSALKLTVGLGLVASLLDPFAGRAGVLVAAAGNLLVLALLAVLVGTIESLIARLKLRVVPQYVVVALVAAAVALLATTWRVGGMG